MKISTSTLVEGGIAGLLGTALMTAFIGGARVAGFMYTPAPIQITANAAVKAGIGDKVDDEPAFTLAWLAPHFAYGAAFGAAFTMLRPVLPRSPLVSGLLFGGGVWALSYLGLMPALKLYPSPEDDSRSRLATMVAAHAVYGVTTAEAARRVESD